MKKYITVPQLVRAGACAPAVARFIELLGTRVEVTVANAEKWAHRFDFGWAMANLLPPGKARRYGVMSYTALARQMFEDQEEIKLSLPKNSPIYWQAIATLTMDYEIAVARSFAKRYLS